METQLHRQCLEVLHAGTVKDFVRISAEFGRSIGMLVAEARSPSLAECNSVTGTPTDYRPIFEDQDAGHQGPVLLYRGHSSLGHRHRVPSPTQQAIRVLHQFELDRPLGRAVETERMHRPIAPGRLT